MPEQLQITLDRPGRFVRTTGPEPDLRPGHAIVRVRRIGVCGSDLHAFAGRQPFFEYPRILGHELGVEIVALAEPHDTLRPGDFCAVEPYLNNPSSRASRSGKTNCCEDLKVLGIHTDGGMRPLIGVPAEKLHRSLIVECDRLALVEMLCIGAHAIDRAEIHHGDYALVIGAGPIGLSTLQFASAATDLVAVMDVSGSRLEFARKQFGVKHTINASGIDVAGQLKEIGGGDLPGIIFDATGNPQSMMRTFDLVSHGGRIVFVGLFQGDVTFNDPNFHRKELALLSSRNATSADFTRVIQMIEGNSVDTAPWITHRIELENVPEEFPQLAEDPALVKAIIEVPA